MVMPSAGFIGSDIVRRLVGELELVRMENFKILGAMAISLI